VRHRRSSRQGARFSAGPLILLVVAGLTLAGLAYVVARMLLAGRPAITLAAPFDVVGRTVPLVVDVRDTHGLKAARITVRQGDQEHVVLDRAYDPPRAADQLRWEPAQEKAFRLQEGPGRLTVWARNGSWGNFMKGRVATLEKDFTYRLAGTEIAANDIASHGQWKSVTFKPPLAKIQHFVQTQVVIEKLTFVDQQSCIATAFDNRVGDFIKRHDFVVELRRVNAQRQKGTSQGSRNCNCDVR